MTPETYCKDKAARRGSAAHYALLFVDPGQRRALQALLAFRREMTDVAVECSDAKVAGIKLSWWREELAKTFQGNPDHPVARELSWVIRRTPLPRAEFGGVIDAVHADLEQPGYPSFEDLARYCHQVSGVVCQLAARVLGYEDGSTLEYAGELGMALQLTEFLRGVGPAGARGRVYLPAVELVRFGITPQMLGRPADGRDLRRLFASQATRVREHFHSALARLPEVDRFRQRSGLAMAAMALATLDEMEADDYRVLQHRVALSPLRKLWLAWTTAIRESRRRRRRRRRQARQAGDHS
jgi:phytoene synthase